MTDPAMLSMALHLREQDLILPEIAVRLVITQGAKKGRRPLRRPLPLSQRNCQCSPSLSRQSVSSWAIS
ncbi:hypothetical protein ACIBI9_59385 [Nonomuraea sp. NPDC050451]|uniref:hypothetical protein n=1 Tax=Nonomuraea sp. NPDC050451 TaxID=3364364 RepID=UPI0037A84775